MGFTPISIEKFIKNQMKSNPKDNPNEVKKQILRALKDYKNGVKCSCGNDIWVIGSAFSENMCFSCITGETYPDDDYEIIGALEKSKDEVISDDIFDIETQMKYYDDDGNEQNPDLYPKPTLCLSCELDDILSELVPCNLNRFGQKAGKEFRCGSYIENPLPI